MKKTNSNSIVVTIAKFGSDPVNVTLQEGATVQDAMNASGVSLTGRETAFVGGEDAEDTDILENGDILSIVTPKQAGNN